MRTYSGVSRTSRGKFTGEFDIDGRELKFSGTIEGLQGYDFGGGTKLTFTRASPPQGKMSFVGPVGPASFLLSMDENAVTLAGQFPHKVRMGDISGEITWQWAD
ncbi:hypothetical protein CPC08DRAFT_716121 [Agrocybe pediades]|nr:hypothetical protein CPC08DRAFT_716121 [Agrocybe pediades]